MPPVTADRLKRVQKHGLGIRYGTDTNGAAYSMSDLGDELNAVNAAMKRYLAIENLDPGGEIAREWDDRLYNSFLMIKKLSNIGSIILVTNCQPGGERYEPGGGRGSQETFAKCHRLPPDSEILRTLLYEKGTLISQMIKWVENYIDDMPDPGANWL